MNLAPKSPSWKPLWKSTVLIIRIKVHVVCTRDLIPLHLFPLTPFIISSLGPVSHAHLIIICSRQSHANYRDELCPFNMAWQSPVLCKPSVHAGFAAFDKLSKKLEGKCIENCSSEDWNPDQSLSSLWLYPSLESSPGFSILMSALWLEHKC